ncbi:MAG: hypothetical protein WCO54_08805 [Bacteroidota bacterium]
METDFNGAIQVANFIEMAGMTKFIISRVGQHKNIVPIFEHIEKGSNEKAVARFKEWASLTDNNLPYEMCLFNSIEDSELNGEEVRNKKQGKINKFTFCLNKQNQYSQQHQQQQKQPDNQNIQELIENALMKQQIKHENNEVLKKLAEMEQRFNDLENGDDDDDESELSGLNNPNVMNIVAMLGKALGGGTKPTAINGLQPEQIKNINLAIKTLAKYDEFLDTDLLKLSNLAETNTATFEMLLKTLRNM